MRIVIGEGSCGIAAGAGKVYDAIAPLVENTGITLNITGCIGMCFLEPIVDIYDGARLLKRLVRVSSENAEEIVNAVKENNLSALEKFEISDEI